MVRGLVIPADSDAPLQIRDFADLHDYQVAVDGWIEAVGIPPLQATMFVNDEGLLRHLPFNSRATFLWWYELPYVRQQAMLVGDVVMVGMHGLDGESTDLSTSTVALLTEQEPYAVVVTVDDSPLWLKHPYPYDDFFEAVVWAMILSERVTGVRAVRVITLDQLHDLDQQDIARGQDPRKSDR